MSSPEMSEVPETPEPEVEVEVEEPAGVDIFGDEAPPSITQYDGEEKDFHIKPEELSGLDPRAMHVLANFRRDYTRKTQALAEERRRVEERDKGFVEQQKALRKAQEELVAGRAKLLAIAQDPRIAKFAESPPVPPEGEPDRWSEEGQAYHLQKAVAAQFKEFLGGWNALSQEEAAKVAEARQGWEREQVIGELKAFMKEHPDFDEYRDQIIELRKESGWHLSAQRAYQLIKAQQPVAEDPMDAARRESRKQSRAAPPTQQRTSQLMPPSGLRGAQLAEWLQKHPDVQAELLRRMKRG